MGAGIDRPPPASAGRKRNEKHSAESGEQSQPSAGAVAASGTEPTAVEAARTALELIFGPVGDRRFAVRFWNGEVDTPQGDTDFTLALDDAGALRRMLLPPSELRITEAFIRGDFDILGNAESAAALAEHIRARVSSPAAIARLTRALLALPSTPAPAAVTPPVRRDADATHSGHKHTPERDAAAVRSHYDVGNDFYALWLDERMVYSCAYFQRPDADIHTAQRDKLEHICRKLRLKPGESLLDVGCGWGGLIMHAAEKYGVNACGITLSYEQAAYAREHIAEKGLSDRCTVEVRDYRHLPPDESFDKLVSVGMVEHVGRQNLPLYFTQLYAHLKPGGLLLNHGIVHEAAHGKPTIRGRIADKLWGDSEFIERYVFPDGELPPLAEVIGAAETAGFETRDVENLREHYARTLRHWVKRLERSRDAAVASAGEQTYRIWRLYMAASAYGFASGRLALDQVLLAKPDSARQVDLPLTRADLYS